MIPEKVIGKVLEHPFVNEANLERLFQLEPRFAQVVERYGHPPSWSRPPGFETLVRIVLEQQLSLASAKAHFDRLRERAGTIHPDRMYELTEADWTYASVSRQKRTYVLALAEAVQRGTLNGLLELDNARRPRFEKVDLILLSIKGIGPWTSSIYQMMSLGHADLFPMGDVALRTSVWEQFGVREYTGIEALSAEWKPLRSLAAFCLWQAYLGERHRVADY
ncbi:DNA-3-methyladenine glycosylase 2 family protein [bacterium]|nr:DNA-3-methyladenine glycosylase 2 family protein [bacterium]